MRILQIITLSELGGAQTVVANIANGLCNEHEVIVAAGEGDGKLFDLLDRRIKCVRCKYLRRNLSIKYDLLSLFELSRIYFKYKPDIIHLHSSKAGLLGRLVIPSCRIVYTVHGFDSIRLAHRKFLPLEKIMQSFCNSIVGVSRYDCNNLTREGIQHNVKCVYNGIKIAIDNDNILNLKDFFDGLSNRYDKIILSIARVSPPKRHDIFIDISKSLPNYAFVWIGNQSEIQELPSNCFFLGNIPNAGALCSYADMFILASDFEGMPMSILEAMSFGKPVVASKVGGVSEIVIDNYNGFTVENKVSYFADKIDYILSNNDVYDEFCMNSLSFFNENFTAEKMVNEYLKIYKSIIKQ